ncbi:DUF3052 domain-containing protein [Streptomyces sp. KS 21]|uniref:DUF3052 domain-containing protein n=1 Tax=Streptomyces sp. KS 21 TaxID=2485150 RepID=UPI0010628528|nr:DUF3052 domain-containing protein [Streptomyces sp. KS 21]TDU67039.1 DUF3052 family protein [Streptomyces sp. KS 21]TDU67991.1 DUF3052 family protein [Streptomyces sp. KS 21]
MTTVDTNLAIGLGFQPGMVVQEIGYDDDVDQELREAIEQVTGTDLVDGEYDKVADAVVLWFRSADGDLTDALVDAFASMEEVGSILLLTPKSGVDGYVEPSEIGEASTTAGLVQTKAINAGKRWNGSRLITPKGAAKLR